jgi:hypothetical protein
MARLVSLRVKYVIVQNIHFEKVDRLLKIDGIDGDKNFRLSH